MKQGFSYSGFDSNGLNFSEASSSLTMELVFASCEELQQ